MGESDGRRLEGGLDQGAVRRGGVVYHRSGPWTPAVRHLLNYLADQGFWGHRVRFPRAPSMRMRSPIWTG